MSEKYKKMGDSKQSKTQNLDRRSYLKTLGATGSGLALGGLGGSEIAGDLPIGTVQAATTIEDFERTDPLSDYSGNTDLYAITTSSSEVIDGSKTLKATSDYPQIGSERTSTPRGYEYRVRIKMGDSAAEPALLVCAQDTSRPDDKCYRAHVDKSAGSLRLALKDSSASSTYTELASASLPSLSNDTVYELAVELGNEELKAVLYDDSGSSVLAETGQASDTTWSGGQLGFYTGGAGGYPAYYDTVTQDQLSDDPAYTIVDNFEPPKDLTSNYRFNKGSDHASAVSDEQTPLSGSNNYTGSNNLGCTYFGEGALEHTGGDVEMFSLESDGLNTYPSPGDTFSCYVLSEGGVGDTYLAYGAQDTSNFYFVNVDFTNGDIRLFKRVNGSTSSINGKSGLSIQPDTWYYVTVHWGTDGIHDITLEDVDENVVGEFTATDNEFGTGGVGFLTYPGDSDEKFYWDDFYVGNDPNDGGWGPEIRGGTAGPDYGADNNAYYLQDFKYLFDYGGMTNPDWHMFHIGGFFHTYTNLSGDENITADEILSEQDIDQVNLELSVTDGNGNLRNDVRLDRYNPNTKMMYIQGGSAYDTWVEENINTRATREEIRQNAVNADTLDPKGSSVGAIDLVAGVLGGVGYFYPPAGAIGAVVAGASLVDDFTDENECGERTNATNNSDLITFDPCNNVALIAYVTEYELDLTDVPSDDSVQLNIDQSVTLDGKSHYAPGNAHWEVLRPGGNLGQYFFLNDSSTS